MPIRRGRSSRVVFGAARARNQTKTKDPSFAPGLAIFKKDTWVIAQVVAHRTTDREVPSLIPTGSWAFFFSSLSYLSIRGVSLNRSLMEVQHY